MNCGGGPDGHSLSCWIVQMHIKENHQNGKDTHIRGIKIYALDEHTLGGTAPAPQPAHRLGPHFEATSRLVMRRLAADDNEIFPELSDSPDRYRSSRFLSDDDDDLSDFQDFMPEPVIR